MLITKESILLACDLKEKEAIIRAMAKQAFEIHRIKEVEPFVQAVLHREAEFSTGVGYGIAIPHGKASVVNEAFVMFCRVDHVDWNSLDGTDVDMVFMIGVPEEDTSNEHLKILALLSRRLMKEDFRTALRTAQSEDALLEILKKWEII
jgi:PTS system fructose-specific IIA component